MAFQPDKDTFRSRLQEVIANIEKSVLCLPSLLKQRCLEKYWSTEKYHMKLSIDKGMLKLETIP